MRFFSFLIAAGTAALALAGPVVKRSASGPHSESIAKRKGGRTFQYFGINEAGAEFGPKSLPGVESKDYIWPSKSSIDVSMESSQFLNSVLMVVLDFGWPRSQCIPCSILDGATEPWVHGWTRRCYLFRRPRKGALRCGCTLHAQY